jgi:hypothetical protein
MNQERYPVTTDREHIVYEFLSEGPMGTIKKFVHYQNIGGNFFNLSFGDWNQEQLKIDDMARSNNRDRNKVLRTVALTAIEFIKYYPDAVILFKGSTPARTRLYQIAIMANLATIAQLFIVEGYLNGYWKAFGAGKNYEAFKLKGK